MSRALFFIFLILLALLATVLTQLNISQVEFNYYFGSTQLPLSLLLLLAITTGALLGLIMTAGIALSAMGEKRRLKQRLQLREQEIRNLREIPIKGRH